MDLFSTINVQEREANERAGQLMHSDPAVHRYSLHRCAYEQMHSAVQKKQARFLKFSKKVHFTIRCVAEKIKLTNHQDDMSGIFIYVM